MNEKIKAYSSTVTAVFSALVVMYGVFKFISQGNENAKSVEKIQVQLKEIKDAQAGPVIRLDSIEQVMRDVSGQMVRVDKKMDRLSRLSIEHWSKDKGVTKDELIEIINELNEKKN